MADTTQSKKDTSTLPVGKFFALNEILKRFYLGNENGSESHNTVFTPGVEDPTRLMFKVEFGEWGASVLPLETVEIQQASSKFSNLMNEDYDQFPMGLLNLQFNKNDESWNDQKYYNAYNYLRNRNEDARAEYIEQFVKGLYTIQKDMPYLFKKISGIENLLKVEPGKGYRVKDAKITLECIEGIDLKIRTLLQLYRKAAYDDVWLRWILPDIYRYFRMIIYVFDRRILHTSSGTYNTDQDDFPIYALECSPCEIDIESTFENEFSTSYTEHKESETKITISVKNVKTYYSNGLFNKVLALANQVHWISDFDSVSEQGDFSSVSGDINTNFKKRWIRKMFMIPGEYKTYYNNITHKVKPRVVKLIDNNSNKSEEVLLSDYELQLLNNKDVYIKQPKNTWHEAVVRDSVYAVHSWNDLLNQLKKAIISKKAIIRDSRYSDNRSMFYNDLTRLDEYTFYNMRNKHMELTSINVKAAEREMKHRLNILLQNMLNSIYYKDNEVYYNLIDPGLITDTSITTEFNYISPNISAEIPEYPYIKPILDSNIPDLNLIGIIDTSLDINMTMVPLTIQEHNSSMNMTELLLNTDKAEMNMIEPLLNLDKNKLELIPLNTDVDDIIMNFIKPDLTYIDISMNMIPVNQSTNDISMNLIPINQDTQDISMNMIPVNQTTNDVSMNMIPVNQSTNDISMNMIHVNQNTQDISMNFVSINQYVPDISMKLTAIDSCVYDISMYMTLLNSSAYDISMYMTLLNSSVYDISMYMTLIDSSSYDISMYMTLLTPNNYDISMYMTLLNSSIYDISMYMTLIDPSIHNISMNMIPVNQDTQDISMNMIPVNQSTNDVSMNLIPVNQDTQDISMNMIPVNQTTNDISMNMIPVNQTTNDISMNMIPVNQTAEHNTLEFVVPEFNYNKPELLLTPLYPKITKPLYDELLSLSINEYNVNMDMTYISLDASIPDMKLTELNNTVSIPLMDMTHISLDSSIPDMKLTELSNTVSIPLMDMTHLDIKDSSIKMDMTQLDIKDSSIKMDMTQPIYTESTPIITMQNVELTTYDIKHPLTLPIINEQKPYIPLINNKVNIDTKEYSASDLIDNIVNDEYEYKGKMVKITDNPKLIQKIEALTRIDINEIKTINTEQMISLAEIIEATYDELQTRFKQMKMQDNKATEKQTVNRMKMTSIQLPERNQFSINKLIEVDEYALNRAFVAKHNADLDKSDGTKGTAL